MLALLLLTSLASAQTTDDQIVPAFGKLVTANSHSVTVRNEKGLQTFHITPQTHIWRGDYVNVDRLRPGDDLSIRYRPQGDRTAVDIEANIERWDGTITKVSANGLEVALQDRDGQFTGKRVTMIFWKKTTFLVDGVSVKDLKVGAFLEAIGLEENDTMRVWKVIGFDAPRLK